ncbi:MAG: PKD repeat protein [Arenicella sp.]|jgi:PKD repeat protein
MRKFFILLIAFLSFSAISNAQCDATFNSTNIDCDSVWFVPASTGSQYVYFWDFGDGNTSMEPSPANNYSTNGTYVVILTIQDTVAGCFQSSTLTVLINCGTSCTVTADFAYTWGNCEIFFAANALSGNAPYSYFWDFGDGNTATGATPNHAFPNNATYNTCLTVTDANGCDTSVCYPVTMQCAPQSCDAQFTISYADCDSVFFYPVDIGSQYTYAWDFNDGNTSTDPYPSNEFLTNGTYLVSLLITDTVTMCQDIVTVPVIINCSSCSVQGAFAHYVDSINCDVNFISTAYGGVAPYTYFWQFGDGQTSNQASPNYNYGNQGTYTPTLTITDANGCDTTLFDVVQAYCNPTSCDAQFTNTYVGCNGAYFFPMSSGLNYTYSWDFGDGNTSTDANPIHNYADGVYQVTLFLEDSLSNCTDSTTQWITINCGSSCSTFADFTYSQNFQNCEFTFVSSAYGGQAPYTYLWDFGDGNTSTDANPGHTYPNSQTYQPCLTVTDAGGCDTTICQAIFSNCTYSPCDAQFTWSLIGCDSVIFYPVANGPQYEFDWSFGDGGTSSDQNPVYAYSSNGVYTVQLVVLDSINNCGDQTIQQIDINCTLTNCNVLGDFGTYADSTDCSTQFVSTAYGGVAPYSYFWIFGDGQTSTDAHPIHTYPNYSTYTPCLTITDANGCDTTICQIVQTNCSAMSCDAQFTMSYLDCNTVQFFSASTGLNFDYQWDFGDGNSSTDATPIHDFADGIHIVYLYVTDSLSGCFDQAYYTIQVSCGGCTVSGFFSYTQDFQNCDITFYPAPYGGQAPYTYFWDFGDGNTSSLENPVHAYPNGSIFTPCLTITDANGCDTTVCDFIVSQCNPPQCDPNFTYTYIGCDSLYFIPVASGPGMTYAWNFGDGTTSTEQFPSHTFTNGIHTVFLAVTDTLFNCFNQTAIQLTINCGFTPCNVQGAFDSNTDPNCYTQFVSTAYGGTAPYSYFWDFGDGNTATDAHPFHNYPALTTWTPCLTITDANGCDTTICDVVVSQCNPTSCDAQFTFTYQDCQTIVFYPVSTGPQYTYFWDFGDGNTSTDDNPANAYPADGTYYVVLQIMDSLSGCQEIITVPITIACGNNCSVTSDFVYQMDFNNCIVDFFGQAYGGQSPYTYFWDYGDGNTSNLQNPVYQYAGGANTYQICLTVTDANGCDTTSCQLLTTNCPQTSCNASFNPAFIGCDSVWFVPGFNDPNVYDYYWDFGDGNSSTDVDPTHTYSSNGTYYVVLTIIDSVGGCSDSFTMEMFINCGASPCNTQGVFQWYSDSSQCNVNFISTAYGGVAPYSYYWNFGDGGTAADANPVHNYAPGTWTPCLTITDANGCDTTYCDVVYSQCGLSIGEQEGLSQFNVYPNPTNGLFFIELNLAADVLIYDLGGKLVHSQSNEFDAGQIKIDIGHLESGTYIIKILSEKEFESKRIIKN